MNKTSDLAVSLGNLRRYIIWFFILFSSPPVIATESENTEEWVETTLNAMVSLQSEVPRDARTSFFLGTFREGNGIVIDSDGLVLTIGYLIMEASDIKVTDSNGQFVPAELVAYDHNSGLGLIKAKKPLGIQNISLGDSSMLTPGDPALILSRIGPDYMQVAEVVDVREFPGYWEYLLDEAIFTAPPFNGFGGAALINTQGELVGVGSLLVNDAKVGVRTSPGNMFVPINLLKPIYDDLLLYGRRTEEPRPWLGVYTSVYRGHLFVYRVAADGPAEQAGIKANDIIVAVNDNPIYDIAEFLREVWATGPAGVEVRISVIRQGQQKEIAVKSADRYDWLKFNPVSKYTAMVHLN